MNLLAGGGWSFHASWLDAGHGGGRGGRGVWRVASGSGVASGSVLDFALFEQAPQRRLYFLVLHVVLDLRHARGRDGSARGDLLQREVADSAEKIDRRPKGRLVRPIEYRGRWQVVDRAHHMEDLLRCGSGGASLGL